MPITLKDIATKVGVSRQAVAAALSLSGSGKVSAELRAKIQQVAAEMDYVPNQTARRLKGISTKTIGLYGAPFVAEITQSYFNMLSEELYKCGYDLLTSYGFTEQTAQHALRAMIMKGVDGVIITTQDNPLAKMKDVKTPYIYCPVTPADSFDIAIDHRNGTYNAAKTIINLGRRRLAYISNAPGQMPNVSPTIEKLAGLAQAAEEAGVEFCHFSTVDTKGNSQLLVSRILDFGTDAVFCCNDYYAARLEHALLASGIRIPEDMMLVGYDGLAFCDLCPVPLSTIIQPMRQFAKESANLILEKIQGTSINRPANRKLLQPYFYQSSSCGKRNAFLDTMPLRNSFPTLEYMWEQERRQC
ncbi:MAG: LacI family transcriptional regulator [Oligosphaeraceae bacterium]|nr:LacI family transcriptional regulator [Oligosphaeraceae bacterium]